MSKVEGGNRWWKRRLGCDISPREMYRGSERKVSLNNREARAVVRIQSGNRWPYGIMRNC